MKNEFEQGLTSIVTYLFYLCGYVFKIYYIRTVAFPTLVILSAAHNSKNKNN